MERARTRQVSKREREGGMEKERKRERERERERERSTPLSTATILGQVCADVMPKMFFFFGPVRQCRNLSQGQASAVVQGFRVHGLGFRSQGSAVEQGGRTNTNVLTVGEVLPAVSRKEREKGGGILLCATSRPQWAISIHLLYQMVVRGQV